MIFLDSNIIIDLVEPNGRWRSWSEARIFEQTSQLALSSVVLAETATQFATLADAVHFMAALNIEILDLSPEAAFRAGKAYIAYREAGGERQAILADFLIGGQASVENGMLLTRDRGRFRHYFPELTLITPENCND